VALSDYDRQLVQRCLAHEPNAWEDFVDRFLGLVIHAVQHTADARAVKLSAADAEELASDVFVEYLRGDYAVLRRFKEKSSLATYLTVVARRVSVREIIRKKLNGAVAGNGHVEQAVDRTQPVEERLANRDQVEQLLSGLQKSEADVVRLYHLEGKSYEEISRDVGVPSNSIGPTLSRARAKLRRLGADSATA
jgi:RNA polymerase sigma-70 factor (ECF subfamily)